MSPRRADDGSTAAIPSARCRLACKNLAGVLQPRLQFAQSPVNVVNRTLPQSVVLGQIVSVIHVSAGFPQQLYGRVNRPSLVASALRRRCMPGILSVVPRGNLDVINGFVNLFDCGSPVAGPRWPGIVLQECTSRTQVGKCVKVRGKLGMHRGSR